MCKLTVDVGRVCGRVCAGLLLSVADTLAPRVDGWVGQSRKNRLCTPNGPQISGLFEKFSVSLEELFSDVRGWVGGLGQGPKRTGGHSAMIHRHSSIALRSI